MNAPRRIVLSAMVLLSAPRAFSKELGQLLYATRAGRAITLKVTDGGHPTQMSLRPEVGEAEVFRVFVLAHAGQEPLVARDTHLLPERAPLGWRVKGNRGDALLKNPEVTYWRYTPGWVIPVRFRFAGQAWALLSADLPPRPVVALPGKAR